MEVKKHEIQDKIERQKAIKELRRIAKKRLVVIVPRQREYPFTFDLHINFFPYKFSLMRVFRNPDAKYFLIDNDWVYIEDGSDIKNTTKDFIKSIRNGS